MFVFFVYNYVKINKMTKSKKFLVKKKTLLISKKPKESSQSTQKTTNSNIIKETSQKTSKSNVTKETSETTKSKATKDMSKKSKTTKESRTSLKKETKETKESKMSKKETKERKTSKKTMSSSFELTDVHKKLLRMAQRDYNLYSSLDLDSMTNDEIIHYLKRKIDSDPEKVILKVYRDISDVKKRRRSSLLRSPNKLHKKYDDHIDD